jgi:hypothetical protein
MALAILRRTAISLKVAATLIPGVKHMKTEYTGGCEGRDFYAEAPLGVGSSWSGSQMSSLPSYAAHGVVLQSERLAPRLSPSTRWTWMTRFPTSSRS